MSIDKENFWDSEPCKNPSLSDEIIALAQTQLGVILPESLIELLKIKNGGYTNGYIFPTKIATSWASDHLPFDALAGINPFTETSIQNILDSEYLIKEWGLPEKLILLEGDGHWWIALDYRVNGKASVVWIDGENGEDIQLAENFDEFLKGLIPSQEYDDEI